MKVLTGGLYLTLGNSWGSCNATATQFGRYSPRRLCDREILPSPSPTPAPAPARDHLGLNKPVSGAYAT